MKQLAEKEYNLYLMWVRRAIGNQVTYASTLEELCNYLFGDIFVGVFARDEIPPKGGYALINLDTHDMPGSHWVARAGDLVYDSFGRNVEMGTRQTENDAEQGELENDCGQRCVAFLCVYHEFGPDVAYYV